jgi:hypothetical protein
MKPFLEHDRPHVVIILKAEWAASIQGNLEAYWKGKAIARCLHCRLVAHHRQVLVDRRQGRLGVKNLQQDSLSNVIYIHEYFIYDEF